MKLKYRYKLYCVVGIGNHAYEKLIPALIKSGRKIIGFVSRTSKKTNPKFRKFSNIDKAINVLPKKTVFLICTPPDTHYSFIKKLLKNKRNMIIEKPILTNSSHVISLRNTYLKASSNLFIKEAFMYRYSLMFNKCFSFIKRNYKKIKNIECNFIVPSISSKSFRSKHNIESSCLYDMGCYIFDFFFSFNLELTNLKILEAKYNKKQLINLNFSFSLENIEVNSTIGLGNKYDNKIVVKEFNKEKAEFHNLFFGRPKNKLIRIKGVNEFVNDKNSFIQMFKEKNYMLNFNKKKNYYRIKKVCEMLDKIKLNLNYYVKNK